MFSIGTISMVVLLSFHPGGPKNDPPKDPLAFSEELGLTEIQIDSIRSIRYYTKKEVIPVQSELRLKRLELRHEMAKENPDEAKIMRLVDQISNVRAQIRKKNLRGVLKVREILTPEQRKKLKEIRMKMSHARSRTKRMPRRMGQGDKW